jgi:serralysin
MPDVPGDNSTTSTLTVGGSTTGTLEVLGDHDWYRITLTEGQTISIAMNGTGAGALEDPYLQILDASGTVLFSNDDGGAGRNALLTFRAPSSGTYYIDAAAWQPDSPIADYTGTGDFTLSVTTWTPPPVWTNDQIANQLSTGYWDGSGHHFNVSQGGSISVNLTALTAEGQNLARSALQLWGDVIGVTFNEVSTGGQITFDDNEEGAFTDSVDSGGIINSAHVNVSTEWLSDYETAIDSYSFQTYIHEIGHALGLGHAGNYNTTADYPFDALFENDAWPATVMSYFSPTENNYYSSRGFSFAYSVTPMVADVIAMGQLYGLSTTTRTGNTTYGFNSTAGRAVFDATQNSSVAYTIFDNGGIDTLDYSGFGADQWIDLNPETFSNVGGRIGNVSIARGTVIENAIGGLGNDRIIGTSGNNSLTGGAGTDTVSYANATSGVQVNLGLSTEQNTVGAGNDTLNGIEGIIGSAFDDILTGSASTSSIHAGNGNDRIVSTAATAAYLYGENGDDWFVMGPGSDSIYGGDGVDTIDYSAMGSGQTIHLALFNSVERLIGTSFADTLSALAAGNTIIGGGGNDTLQGISNAAVNLQGGTGNDTYNVYRSDDIVTEAAGEGVDLVRAGNNFTLGANVENLTLIAVFYDPYAGAAPIFTPPPPSDFYGYGNSVANIITGNTGANVLRGYDGTDTLNGAEGADTLTGGTGADSLTGGVGTDIFFDTSAGLNGDTIVDFSSADRIVFSDANLATFTFSLSGSSLTYTGGSLTFGASFTGTLRATAASEGGVQLAIATTNALHDFNGDGRSDILWRSSTGQLSDWLGQVNGGFVGNDANAFANVPTNWSVAGTGDFNGDGRDDVLWRSNTGQLSDWLGQANGGFVSNDANAFANVPTNWSVAGTGDFNGDGRDDVLWRSDSGAVSDWLGQANGGFVTNDTNAFSNVPTNWHIAGTGDFNGDGRDDILWRSDSGALSDWLGQANGGFVTNDATAFTNVPTNWNVVGTGDFNGDGRDDVLWRSNTGQLSNWLGQANGGFVTNDANALSSAPTNWHVADVGDYNGDGRDDILWRSDSGQLSDWLGTASGGFVTNDANAFNNVPTNWFVQSPDSLWV